MNNTLEIYFDGACNNTGDKIMGIGVVAYFNGVELGSIITNQGKGTSNEAEWLGCFYAMKLAVDKTVNIKGKVDIHIYSDSQLIVNQFNGKFKINKKLFRDFKNQAMRQRLVLVDNFKSLTWIKRELNTRADELSKEALKLKKKEIVIH